MTNYLFEHDANFGLKFSERMKKLSGVILEATDDTFGETDDDIAFIEVQRLRAKGKTYKDTAFGSPISDRIRKIWEILHDGFSRGYWDFLYLLEESNRRGLTFKADYVGVDEINDLTPIQCQIVERSVGKTVVLCGDMEQSIHEWAGVDPRAILSLSRDAIEYQSDSYRLTGEIASLANKISSRLTTPPDRKIHALAGRGEIIRDGNWVNVLRRLSELTSNTFVLGRSNYLCDKARKIAIENGANIVYTDDEALQIELYDLIVNMPRVFPFDKAECMLGSWLPTGRFWKHGAKKKLRDDMNATRESSMPWDTLYENYGTPDLKRLMEGKIIWERTRERFDPTKPYLRFMTCHTSKGLEEENVVVLRDMDTRVRDALWREQDSEIKLAYVACTRAKKRLFLTDLGGSKLNPYII